MTYQVLARKWRPRSFEAMVGQSAVQKALRSMLLSQKLPHAFLFSGTRGVGKTTLARLFAKCMLCEKGISDTPCSQCSQCIAVDTGTHLDVIEVDAASRTKVEDTRDLMENVPYAPHTGRFKIYIIDEVHMLSNHSFNALLKTLEEPPQHVKFIFATTEPEKCPVTMLSRCVHFTLKALSVIELTAHLKTVCEAEQLLYDEAGLRLLAEKAKGSVRDALTLLEEARHVGAGRVAETDVQAMLGLLSLETLLPLVEAVVHRDAAMVLHSIEKIDAFSPDYEQVVQQLIGLWHSIAVYQIAHYHHDTSVSSYTLQRYAEHFSPESIQLFYQISLKGQQELALARDPKMGFEMLMLRLLAFVPGEIKTQAPAQTTPSIAITRESASAPSPLSRDLPKAQESSRARESVVVSNVMPSPTSPTLEASRGAAPSAALAGRGDDPIPPPARSFDIPKVENNGKPDWFTLMPQLNLSGLTKMLAEGAALLETEEGLWTLAIPSKLAPMINKMQSDKIAQAISEILNQKIVVKFEVKNVSFETPATIYAAQREAKRDAMQTQVAEDVMLQDLIKSFDATIERVSEAKDEN